MRWGYSWPYGHGRRAFVSYGPLGTLAVVLFRLVLALALLILYGAGWALIGLWWLAKSAAKLTRDVVERGFHLLASRTA